ncbi:hypothetical protein SEA_PHARAOH_72 [Mycobacterium phage Pharaoh]|uniref:Uncharacterized protein n=1 Tax=Mycobacterium phage Pharaoh TaxID=2530140 RepID=A0A481W212_9CAUD|nr:hypothetical protein KIV59_gp18 [Mycobacterium phage Pharaoh]QBJ00260.1 hypothetical protein SEA_PHARAOH_72 [Mycobacterium phage Pharaoh]
MKVFVATIETRYETMAVAETEAEAIRLAGEKAVEFLKTTSSPIRTSQEAIDYLGVTVTEVAVGSAVIIS